MSNRVWVGVSIAAFVSVLAVSAAGRSVVAAQAQAKEPVAFTTDAGQRWANDWTGWDSYDRYFSQMVRWSMRSQPRTSSIFLSTDATTIAPM